MEQLLCFWVVLCSNPLLVKKVLQFAFMGIELKSMAIKCIFEFMAANIMDRGRKSRGWSIVALWFPNVHGRRSRTVFVLFTEGQRGLNVSRALGDRNIGLFRAHRTMGAGKMNNFRRHTPRLIL